MTTPDFSDWSQPVQAVEHVQGDLIPGGVIAANGPSVPLDTSRYASLSFQFHGAGLGAGNRYQLQLQWLQGINVVDWDTVSFHDPTFADTYPGLLMAQVPVRAERLAVWVVGETNSNIGVSCYGSTRALATSEARLTRYQYDGLLLETALVSIAAGAAGATWRVPPVSRAYAVRVASAAAAVPFHVNLSAPAWTLGVLNTAARVGQWSGAATLTVSEVPLPCEGSEWVVTNDDTVARTIRLSVWDVS